MQKKRKISDSPKQIIEFYVKAPNIRVDMLLLHVVHFGHSHTLTLISVR